MKKENKNKIVLIVVIVILLVGCGVLGYFIYDLNENNKQYQNEIQEYKTQIQKFQDNNQIESNNLNSIAGGYQYIIEYTEQPGLISYIDLMEDGTFYKSDASTAKQWWYGTYTLENDTLTLSATFTVSSDVHSAQTSSETFTYTVSNNKLIDNEGQTTYTKNPKIAGVQEEFIKALETIAEYVSENTNS